MENTQNLPERSLTDRSLADAWAELQVHAQQSNAGGGLPLQADAYRLAFADPEFLLRRETRGVRMQLEMLKPDLEQTAQGVEHTIVVFGSARFLAPDAAQAALAAAQTLAKVSDNAVGLATAQRDLRNALYYDQARLFARLVAGYSAGVAAADKLYICTGGGPGIMEAANRGAFELGAPTVGLNIALPHEQSANPYVSASLNFKFHYFALRKLHFMMRAKALVAFPGGFGTLDELFEVITLVQTRKAKPVPIVLYGSHYWRRLLNLEVLVEVGTISPEDLKLFSFADTPEVAWDTIRQFYAT